MGGWEEETSMHAGASANGSAVDRGERGRGERSEETGGGGDSSTKSRGRRDGEEETNRLLAGIDACLVIGRESRGRGLLVGSVADWRGVRMGRRRSSRWVGGVCARMAASLRRWGPVVLVVLLAGEGRKAGGHGEERKTAASSERRGRWGGGGGEGEDGCRGEGAGSGAQRALPNPQAACSLLVFATLVPRARRRYLFQVTTAQVTTAYTTGIETQ